MPRAVGQLDPAQPVNPPSPVTTTAGVAGPVDGPRVEAPQSLGRAVAGQRYLYLQLAVVVIFGLSLVFFFNFTAEDAYITYRYAENLVNHGALVYNLGEPINALTSPLHALLSAAVYAMTGQTVLGNKVVALLLLLGAVAAVWRRYPSQPQSQLLVLALLLLPPSILLWTVGGLETPLLLFLVTLAAVLTDQPAGFSPGRLRLVLFLSGLAYLTRFDSVLFFLPLVLQAALRTRSLRRFLLAVPFGAALPLAWTVISLLFYGDLLPTSFYVKTPSGSLGTLLYNGLYIAGNLIFVGLVPVAALALARAWKTKPAAQGLSAHLRRHWWLYAGIGLELLYGLTMATHHMMFSFRFFVPYLPASALVVVDLWQSGAPERGADQPPARLSAVAMTLFLGLALFQVYQLQYTYLRSVNGISPRGEYHALGLRDYVKFMDLLRQEARDIEADWASLGAAPERLPRVSTFAAGMLPYTFRDTYIYEQLVSYRHCLQRTQQRLHADYLHILAPRQGELAAQLPKPESSYRLVSAYVMDFDGSPQNFLVYYDPAPAEHNLRPGINDFCRDLP